MGMEQSRRGRGERVGGPGRGKPTGDREAEAEISLSVEVGRPRFIRVGEGDRLWEGDRQPVSTTLHEWEVERVGEETVEVVDERTGDRRAWDRSWVEQQLVAGAMSTNLGGVEWIRLREWSHPIRGSYLTVLAHADNGRTYVRRYRPTDDSGVVLELWTDDPETRWLSETGRATLDREVAAAVTDRGVAIRESS